MTNTVLVVDDEQVLAGAMGDYLGRYGYSVNIKNSGEEALRVIDSEPLISSCSITACRGWTAWKSCAASRPRGPRSK